MKCIKIFTIVMSIAIMLFAEQSQAGTITELTALPTGSNVVLSSSGTLAKTAAAQRGTGINAHDDYKKFGQSINDSALGGDEVNMVAITMWYVGTRLGEGGTSDPSGFGDSTVPDDGRNVTLPDDGSHVLNFWFGEIGVDGAPIGGVINSIDVSGQTFNAGKYYRFSLDTPWTYDASMDKTWGFEVWWDGPDALTKDLAFGRTDNNDVFDGGMLFQRNKTRDDTSFPFTSGANAVRDMTFTMEVIPEPASMLLLGLGGLAVLRKKK